MSRLPLNLVANQIPAVVRKCGSSQWVWNQPETDGGAGYIANALTADICRYMRLLQLCSIFTCAATTGSDVAGC